MGITDYGQMIVWKLIKSNFGTVSASKGCPPNKWKRTHPYKMPIEGFKPYISKQAISMHQPSDISQWSGWMETSNIYTHLELQTTTFLYVLWLFQADDSKSFHHVHPFKTALFRVPGPYPKFKNVTNMFGVQVKFPMCAFILFLEPVCPLFWGLNYPKEGPFGFQVVIYQTQISWNLFFGRVRNLRLIWNLNCTPVCFKYYSQVFLHHPR